MKHLSRILPLLALSVLSCQTLFAANAREEAWEAQNLEVRAAVERGDLVAALRSAETAATLARSAFGEKHIKTAVALKKLSDLQRLNGKTRQAASTLGQAGEIWEGALGAAHPFVSELAAQGADDLASAGDPQGAVRMMSGVVEDQRRYYGERHSAVAASLLDLARLERSAGSQAAALLHERQAAAMLADTLGPGNTRTLDAYAAACERLAAEGNVRAARTDLKQILDRAAAAGNAPLVKLSATWSLNGDLALQDRDLVDAEASYDRAWDLLERAGDLADPQQKLDLLYKRREFYQAAGRTDAALGADEKARQIEASVRQGPDRTAA